MKRKILIHVLLIQVLLICNILNACGVNQENNISQVEFGSDNEKIQISLMVYNTYSGQNTAEPESEVEDILEQRFNIEINIIPVNRYDKTKLDYLIASGQIPDVIQVAGGSTEYIDQGLIQPLNIEMLEQNMPEWIKNVKFHIGEGFNDKIRYKGKIWGIPIAHYFNNTGIIAVIRKDWLDNLGYDHVPETLDEMYEIFYDFRYKDPDKNGIKDTYAINIGWMPMIDVYTNYGILPDSYWVSRDGDVFATNVRSSYKGALKLLHEWYEMELIDPESIAEGSYPEKFAKGKFGFTYGIPGWTFFENIQYNPDNFITLLKEYSPEAELEYVEPVNRNSIAFTNERGISINYDGTGNENFIMFSKFVDYNKIVRVMQMEEEIFKDEELFNRLYWGEENIDYVKGDEYYNYIIPAEKVIEKGLNAQFAAVPFSRENLYYNLFDLESMYELYYSQSLRKDILGVEFYAPEVNVALCDYGDEVNEYAKRFRIDAITGNIDIEDEWEEYVKTINAMGLEKIVEEYQEIYDKYN